MLFFWVLAVLMLLIAAAFVLWPLRKQQKSDDVSQRAMNVTLHQQRIAELKGELEQGLLSEEQFSHALHEEERALLQDVEDKEEATISRDTSPVTAIIVTGLIVLFAFGLYWRLGDHHFLTEQDKFKQVVQQHQKDLRQHLQQKPRDAEAWARLGRLHMIMGELPESVKAYEQAYALVGNRSAQILADYAEALGRLNNNSLLGRPEQLVKSALKVEPNNPSALLLAGFVHYQKRNFKQALHYWYRLRRLKPGANPSLAKLIAEAESLSGIKPKPAQGIKVVVRLHQSIRSRVGANDHVFIYAQASQGPRMPLAMVRKRVSDLPVTVVLGDAQAIPGMPPAIRLSRFPRVVLKARVSRSGQATMQPGDFFGQSQAVSNRYRKPVFISIRQQSK